MPDLLVHENDGTAVAATAGAPKEKTAVDFLVHDKSDNVGVAVVDIRAGQAVTGVTLDDGTPIKITARQDISLGHKIALRDLNVGDTVTKYGEDIGRVVLPIQSGYHVHVHNLKTKRW